MGTGESGKVEPRHERNFTLAEGVLQEFRRSAAG